jgi:7-carboxy-7-deazaguanine synthase
MVINEIFYSLQGEGLLAGVPAIFIRLAGCSLRCKWCDTKYALDPSAGEELSISQIIDRVDNIKHSPLSTLASAKRVEAGRRPQRKNIINSAHSAVSAVKGWAKDGCNFVVITGGEPMINPQLPELTAELKKHGKHITIETAGIKFIPDLACDLMSISPKTSNSGQTTENFSATRQLIERYPYQLKFVVDTPDDLPEIQRAIEQIGNVIPERIMLMPQAKTRDELIAKSPMVAELCKQTGYTFCNRLQILLYDGARGK